MRLWFPLCKRTKRRVGRGQRGFTLVEMMVAVGITSFILFVLMQMINATSTAWNSGTRRVDAFREARAALHVMERDFAGMKTDWYKLADLNEPAKFVERGGYPVIIQKGSEINSALSLAGAPTKPGTQAVFFLSTTSDLTTSPSQRTSADGDLCTVGYYVAYGPEDVANPNSRKTYKLYRYFKPSQTTFNRVYEYLTDNSVTFANFMKDNNVGGSDPKTADQHEPLAFNVTDFTVKAYYYGTGGVVTEFITADAGTSGKPVRPDFVEITIGVLGNQSVAKLPPDPAAWQRAPLGGPAPSTLAGRILTQEARVFTTRIECQ